MVSLVDFAPTILDIAGVPIPEGHGPPTPVAAEAPPAWPGSSLVPVLEGSGHGKGRALIEDDQDNLGFRVRTLVTSRYRLTAYSGHSYGELFDFQEDPGSSATCGTTPRIRRSATTSGWRCWTRSWTPTRPSPAEWSAHSSSELFPYRSYHESASSE